MRTALWPRDNGLGVVGAGQLAAWPAQHSGGGQEDDQRCPVIEPQSKEVVGMVDAQRLHRAAPDREGGDVERKQLAARNAEAPIDPQQQRRNGAFESSCRKSGVTLMYRLGGRAMWLARRRGRGSDQSDAAWQRPHEPSGANPLPSHSHVGGRICDCVQSFPRNR